MPPKYKYNFSKHIIAHTTAIFALEHIRLFIFRHIRVCVTSQTKGWGKHLYIISLIIIFLNISYYSPNRSVFNNHVCIFSSLGKMYHNNSHNNDSHRIERADTQSLF